MSIDVQRVRIFRGQYFELRVAFKRTSEVKKITIHASNNRIVRQARADRFRNVKRTRALRHGLVAAVRQRDSEHTHLALNFERIKRPELAAAMGVALLSSLLQIPWSLCEL